MQFFQEFIASTEFLPLQMFPTVKNWIFYENDSLRPKANNILSQR
jgi:hypothetical protein